MTTELTILYSWRLQAHEIRRNMRNLTAGIDSSRQNSDAKNKGAVGGRESHWKLQRRHVNGEDDINGP